MGKSATIQYRKASLDSEIIQLIKKEQSQCARPDLGWQARIPSTRSMQGQHLDQKTMGDKLVQYWSKWASWRAILNITYTNNRKLSDFKISASIWKVWEYKYWYKGTDCVKYVLLGKVVRNLSKWLYNTLLLNLNTISSKSLKSLGVIQYWAAHHVQQWSCQL